MTVLTALARVAAANSGHATATKTVRHVHLGPRPLVLVAAQLAGEACAPLAVMVGDDRDAPRLLVVYEPRDRSQRFAFAADLADIVLKAIESYVDDDGTTERSEPYTDAPQLVVPNQPTASFIRLLGRSTRFRRTEGEYAVPASVPVLGRWLTYFSERAEVSPAAQLLALTTVLGDHWATGQSATEDANLGALLAWIDPPDGVTGRDAARAAEDPARCPPAGPVTDPGFDNDVLAPRLAAARSAATVEDPALLRLAQADLEAALRSQLEPTWRLVWRGIDLLRALPAAAHVEQRWQSDRWSFTNQVAWIRGGGAPQARRDSAVAAAKRLARLEREQQKLDVERAYDDPLVMAEFRMTGEAFAGDVVVVDPARLDQTGKRPVLRPWITVATADEVLAEVGAVLKSPLRPKQDATVKDIAPGDNGMVEVVLELKGGMGRSLTPPPGSVPAVGDNVTYTSLRDDFQHPPKFPEPQDTPWTHGGPPPEYVPNDEDAAEAWSQEPWPAGALTSEAGVSETLAPETLAPEAGA
jgi:hypothetical protein